jgi:hypothetical protein
MASSKADQSATWGRHHQSAVLVIFLTQDIHLQDGLIKSLQEAKQIKTPIYSSATWGRPETPRSQKMNRKEWPTQCQ